ncbi:peptide ABC transporter substrate-binding protein [Chromatiales bacterium (ex Bugula neritina AB1)]|nr:peptide ABC transporter substrate-binding protein [Chromatiales bacterium (ex Bugula neritina AB1)]
MLGVAMAAAMQFSSSNVLAEPNQLSDVKVRQAIAYAIDMDTIVETLFEGKAIVADSMIPNGAFKAPGLNKYAYDPDKARALLKEAGWDKSQVLDVVYYYGDQLTADLMVAMQAYLADVGIDMTYRKLEGDVGEQLNVLPAPDSDTSAVKWDIAYGAKAALALQEYYNGYRSNKNSYTPANPDLDKLIDGINASADPEVQIAAFAEFEKYENEMLSDIPLYYQQLFIYESDRIDRAGGLYGNAQFNYDWGIHNWEVTADDSGKKVAYTNTAPSQFFEHPLLNPGLYIHSKVVFDRLLTVNGSLVPTGGQLAESYQVADDGMSVEFTLKDGLTWHDGEPLTAADVAWSIEAALKVPAISAVFSNTFNSIDGAKAFVDGSADSVSGISVDGNTIAINFATLDPNFMLTFGQFPPMPKHLLGDMKAAEFQQHPFWQKPVGSGPFKIAEVQMNDYVRYVPFADYHGGVAKMDEIVSFPSGENDANVLKNAAAKRLDFGFTKSVADVKGLEEMAHMRVVPADIPYTRSLRINKYANKP